MEFDRAFPGNEKFNAAQRSPIDVPIVVVSGEHSFGPLLPKSLRLFANTAAPASQLSSLNKNAIIYGTGGSIGGAVARAFACEGATVCLVGRTLDTLDKVARGLS
jgi:hypothetical protein